MRVVAHLEQDALPARGVDGLENGRRRLELASAPENVPVEDDVLWQLCRRERGVRNDVGCRRDDELSRNHFGGVKGFPSRLIMFFLS